MRDAERELTGGGGQRLLYRVFWQRSDRCYADLKECLFDLEEAIRSNAALSGIKDDVAKLLERVSLMTAGEDHSINFHFSAPDATEMVKKIGMIYGANPISVARNGLGRNNLLYVALVLSQLAKAADPSPSNEAFVCIRFAGIEEPEAHLHPHLQDHLANNIETIRREYADSLQLLLTSHSTYIATKLRLDNIAIMFRDEQTGRLSSHYVLDGIDPIKERNSIRFLSLYLAREARGVERGNLFLVGRTRLLDPCDLARIGMERLF